MWPKNALESTRYVFLDSSRYFSFKPLLLAVRLLRFSVCKRVRLTDEFIEKEEYMWYSNHSYWRSIVLDGWKFQWHVNIFAFNWHKGNNNNKHFTSSIINWTHIVTQTLSHVKNWAWLSFKKKKKKKYWIIATK